MFEHNVVWDSLHCALDNMSIHMIPLVEILMLLFYCVMTNHFKDELLFSAKTCNLKLCVYIWMSLPFGYCSLFFPNSTHLKHTTNFVPFFSSCLSTLIGHGNFGFNSSGIVNYFKYYWLFRVSNQQEGQNALKVVSVFINFLTFLVTTSVFRKEYLKGR